MKKVIFGAGIAGGELYRHLKQPEDVVAWVDNDERLWGGANRV